MHLIGVDASAQLDPAAEERLQSVLEGRHSGASADEHDVRDVTHVERRVFENGSNRVDAPVEPRTHKISPYKTNDMKGKRQDVSEGGGGCTWRINRTSNKN